MKILLSGASGLVGTALTGFLNSEGHQVLKLVRHPSKDTTQIPWSPSQGQLEASTLEGFDAVIHLAGESLAGGPWSPAKKARILNSRVNGTQLLSQTLSQLKTPPKVMISASAVGYYGDTGSQETDETGPLGQGFLAEVCQAWEAAAEPVKRAGIRLVKARLGVVLSTEGGALKAMLPPFKLGLGGQLGSGQQYMSWIAMDDLLRAFAHCLSADLEPGIPSSELRGAVNFTAPEPVQNKDFTQALAEALKCPAFFTVPSLVLKLALGEMAEEMLLNSTRVYPEKLLSSGFEFHCPQLAQALHQMLN